MEGEIFLLIVGIFIKVGLLNPLPALISAIFGAFTHELIYFFFGRWKGREFLLKNSYTRKRYRKARELVDKYGNLSIFIIRFLYGMRVIPMVFLGATKFNPVRFVVLDLLSLLIWAFLYICLGYFFGHAAEKYFGKAKEIYLLIGVGIAIVAFLFIVLKLYRIKKIQ